MVTMRSLRLKATFTKQDLYLDVLYQLIQKLSIKPKQKMPHKPDFKTFLLNIPKTEELEIER